jgi:hypothetical protein
MVQTSYLLVDMLKADGIGGYTTDPIKIDFNLQVLRLDKVQLQEKYRNHPGAILVYPAGGYVMVLHLHPSILNWQIAFIHFEFSIDEWFNHFADSFTPKTVQAIFETQQKIKAKGSDFQQAVVLRTDLPAY